MEKQIDLGQASRNAGTLEEGEPGSQCGSLHALLRVRTMLFSLLREDCTRVFLQTHKTAMVGNVLTPWGVIARGGNRPVVKLCSPYPRLFFFGITNMLGVDSCVFLIFTTRVDPNKRNKHRLKDWIPNCDNRKYRVSKPEKV